MKIALSVSKMYILILNVYLILSWFIINIFTLIFAKKFIISTYYLTVKWNEINNKLVKENESLVTLSRWFFGFAIPLFPFSQNYHFYPKTFSLPVKTKNFFQPCLFQKLSQNISKCLQIMALKCWKIIESCFTKTT